MPTLEAPISAKVTHQTDPVDDQLPAPYRTSNGREGSTEVLQHCLDLAVTGNQAANRTIRQFVATVERLAHAPFDLGRAVVHSAVVVDVDVDVDIASQQCALQESDHEER